MTLLRRRKPMILGLIAVALLTLIALGWLAVQRLTLTAAERNLLGTWRQTRDNAPATDPIVEFEFRSDRRVTLMNRDAVTGSNFLTVDEYDDWRLNGDELWLRRATDPKPVWHRLKWWDRSSRPADLFDVLKISPDSNDRYQYIMVRCDIYPIHTGFPPPTGTWTRVTPPPVP